MNRKKGKLKTIITTEINPAVILVFPFLFHFNLINNLT